MIYPQFEGLLNQSMGYDGPGLLIGKAILPCGRLAPERPRVHPLSGQTGTRTLASSAFVEE
ncbi:unnamed protein product [Protopolystoma xenopodis]|uniref:Uncharacterized protein n=1 Tax=Protopolystoma xenopodis TaxID=117903 RepID=A0A448WUW3_9PLAT|nr:unnamed protein product [Protopolystoma xenopodis]